ncbi:chemotaxis protein CheB [Heliorestis convoluta]|uniref:Stage 0 sporulation protein A homolog n=1 Tax=Heliorestis convoluta TaxID=356322 RepID=A0A5Q2N1K0_9FIRM|nr:chemotaxis protein CheB [Heliorestis convoluta]QGG46240.1 PAS domain-containing protein [Heliorestis convoluta]
MHKGDVDHTNNTSENLWVLAIGASAGGLRVIQEVLSTLTPNEKLVVLVVQHLSPRYPSHLTSILKRASAMDVQEAVNNKIVEGGTIYVATPNHHIYLQGHRIVLDAQSEKVNFARPSIDVLFESTSEVFGARTIGLILSGTGSDGSNGIVTIKENGGFTIAQESTNSCYNAMPQNAINTGAIDFILPTNEISKVVSQIIEDPESVRKELTIDEHLEIIDLLRTHQKVDFFNYRRSTFKRRVRKRMTYLQLNSIKEYIDYLRNNPQELAELHNDLLINVTHFMRDDEAFASLRQNCLRSLVEKKDDGESLRIWSVGCSTGEEVYSVAFMVADLLEQTGKKLDVKIYATDIDEAAILEARRGLYIDAKMASLPEDYRKKFMTDYGDYCKVKKEIRSWIIFGVQDVISAPPIAKVDLVICRNLLIYFEKELQKKVLSKLHYAINPQGFLFLGKSETTSILPAYFKVIDRRWRIYQNQFASTHRVLPIRSRNNWIETAPSKVQQRDEHIREIVLENIPFPMIALNNHLHVLFYNRRAKEIFQGLGLIQPEGTIDGETIIFNILEEEKTQAFREAFHTGIVPTYEKVELPYRDSYRYYSLQAFLDERSKESTLVLLYCPIHKREEAYSLKANQKTHMERELNDALTLSEELQATVEELETTNEELQAANEELETTNEELEASNEELETINEELEATNEELETINEELDVRSIELQNVSNLKNSVLSCINVAVIAVDLEGIVMEWNPAAVHLFDIPVYRALQRNFFVLNVPPIFDDLRQYVERCAAGEEVNIIRTVATWQHKKLNIDYVPLLKDNVTVMGILIVAYDITEQYELQHQLQKALLKEHQLVEELAEAKTNAEKANHLKTQFIAELSHDLRGSLNVILGMSQLGIESCSEWQNLKNDDNELQLLFETTYKAAVSLNEVLTQVLELSAIELGKKTIENKVFSSAQLLEQINAVIAYKAKRAQIRYLEYDEVPSHCLIECDFSKTCQVLLNLLDNAIKYSKSGGEVSLQMKKEDDDLVLLVKDKGIGMSQETVEQIFNPFYRNRKVKAITGSGLGMAITEKMVKTMNGTIEIESEQGQGTTVTTRLPVRFLKKMEDKSNKSNPITQEMLRPNWLSKKVLIADDDRTSTVLCRQALMAIGSEVITASTVKEALEQAQKVQFDLLLMELQLSDGEGRDIISALSKEEAVPPKVVLVSRDAVEIQLSGEWQCYAQEVLAKPLSLEQFYALLWRMRE